MALQRILVPIDFSAASLKAHELAVRHFGRQGLALVAMHVVDDVPYSVEDDPKAGMHVIDERERRVATLIAQDPGVWSEARIVIVSGRPAEQIVRVADEVAADLVVMGGHGSQGFVDGLFGSTTYTVARKLKCAVLISK